MPLHAQAGRVAAQPRPECSIEVGHRILKFTVSISPRHRTRARFAGSRDSFPFDWTPWFWWVLGHGLLTITDTKGSVWKVFDSCCGRGYAKEVFDRPKDSE